MYRKICALLLGIALLAGLLPLLASFGHLLALPQVMLVLAVLGVLLVIVGIQMISIGFIGDMLVDATYHSRYNEAHVKEKL